jgi:GNAT superfamily N-acetyltransferase
MAVARGVRPVDDPSAVLAIFDTHRAIHTYGIVDVVQFWDTSHWWVRDGAVVGLVGLPGIPAPVVYAVSAVHGGATLSLLADLVPQLPDRFDITGPAGLTERLRPTHRATRSAPHVKMHLLRADMLPPPDPEARALEPDDLDEIRRLGARSDASLQFFREDLLGTGRHFGIFAGAALEALAGVHVIDVEQGIAAIGDVATVPERRGQGMARRVLATLCHRLRTEVDIIGLNVGRDNTPARTLYEHVGFLPLMEYEEAELVRR